MTVSVAMRNALDRVAALEVIRDQLRAKSSEALAAYNAASGDANRQEQLVREARQAVEQVRMDECVHDNLDPEPWVQSVGIAVGGGVFREGPAKPWKFMPRRGFCQHAEHYPNGTKP